MPATTGAPLPDTPSDQTLGRALRLLEPARRLINPKVYGTENLPRRSLLRRLTEPEWRR